jgi:hypothetical protein
MAEPARAQEVVLRKLKPLAPPFHQHIARGRLLGQTVRPGDRVVIYEVAATAPPGPVLVVEETLIRFE